MTPAADRLSERMRSGPGSADALSADGTVDNLTDKERELGDLIASFGSIIVAFSGGVDSAYLGWIATQRLGSSALCITADSPSYPDRHRQLANRTAREFGLRHEVIHTHELDVPAYRANAGDRCYYCKSELYGTLARIAEERGFSVVADGSNADDRTDFRPGRRAAREFGIRSPLDDVGLTKAGIRELARRAALPVWDEPASACLSSRIPHHSEVTVAKLEMIEQAEEVLHGLGFRVCRVRHHDMMARLEIGLDELPRALEPALHDRIVRDITAIGYQQVTIDPRGYRMGSLNEGVRLRPV